MSATRAIPSAGRRFPTTSWTLVIDAGQASPQALSALGSLCDIYWTPVYAFICSRGYSAEDAKDLTQEFFARMLEGGYFREARRDRGRFRSFLLASVNHFLANSWDRDTASKRGGRTPVLSLDAFEGRAIAELADCITPESIFDRQWAITILDSVTARLQDEYTLRGQASLFQQLKPMLAGTEERGQYQRLEKELQLTQGALRVALYRLRRRFAEILRAEIAETVGSPDEIDDELRHLLEVVSGP